ncbi:hypothetical protein EYZ11_008282 [Aspergillus tanneri]|uniref:Bromo domain-containing protein n=1 Tax=Aspergillus tanneri TaxID=1220188 RepID=A0A4S3JB21_9EURO|nr:uncharacterized protein ATNIH1004_003446 [Aspergillus tanneri]KAA8650757.1 hypothetical protein ATNIH1004_003446 [Aspergillus tanneri]THC92250.1 hypothetical protein EYZ11_008282 [Aspergillus tanneri]
MPPLSAYTPFESLLFFQSLAALDARPADFVSISDRLRSNRFVRDNVAFDAGRLAPEALEDLYSTLMREGIDTTTTTSTHEPNGRHEGSHGSNNPKKRKITSPRPDGLVDKGIGHAGIAADFVTHLYARYKELATKEIRNEEKKYNEIRDEIERLKQEREAPQKPLPTPLEAQKPIPEVHMDKRYSSPEPMDVDHREEKPIENPHPNALQSAVGPETKPEVNQPQPESQHKEVVTPQQPTQVTPRQTAQHQVPLSASPVKKSQEEQPRKPIPPQSQLAQHQHQQPLHPRPIPPASTPQLSQVQSPDEKISAPHAPALASRDIPTAQAASNIPPIPPQIPPTPSGPAASSVQGPTTTPSHSLQKVKHPVSHPTPIQAAPIVKAASKEASTMPAPTTAQRPAQPSFQQWALNQAPQAPHPSYPKAELSGQIAAEKNLSPTSSQQTPKPQSKKVQSPLLSMNVPSTPLSVSTTQSPAPSGSGAGFETPMAAAYALLRSQSRGPRPPRLSIDTSGSVTPWKKTPRLSIPHSPRSPDRPRPEDVSPISEKAPSLMGSREATPEEHEPQRRKRRQEAKGSRGREPSFPATDMDSKTGLRKKQEKLTISTRKRRDRSVASSRSRGRSVLSRDEESATESLGKIKHEMPSTPACVPDAVEPDHRVSGGRKGALASEERPGRGRPKRKRAPSETLEAEPIQPDINQLNRIDPNQSAPYVLCARNFPRTTQPIMNDVTTHKHASIFTKPLTERDAPGYRDLIYRPQDLKSIKSSIHQGSKALAAATEAVSTPVADGESPAPNAGTPSKNAVLMLQKSEDVIPPKAIVNSAQLEKELIRMFANAVMFNPVPQRGFGVAFPMTSDGGSRESTQVPEPDEGGIIKDTQEMFEDVEQAVTRWRAAERTTDELVSKSILSLRRGSASDLNTDSADEVKG